ncbi:MAG: hypothetical protein JNM68_04800 [Dinghuibacter sp.]|nr:hypothetical protein [Dinghuibacter sp.]
MKLNIFNSLSPLFPYRWFITLALALTLFMLYHDVAGKRMFTGKGDQEWNSSGPGHHK